MLKSTIYLLLSADWITISRLFLILSPCSPALPPLLRSPKEILLAILIVVAVPFWIASTKPLASVTVTVLSSVAAVVCTREVLNTSALETLLPFLRIRVVLPLPLVAEFSLISDWSALLSALATFLPPSWVTSVEFLFPLIAVVCSSAATFLDALPFWLSSNPFVDCPADFNVTCD